MNRPDSSSLNSNAEATAAAKLFAMKQAEEQEFKPAIATGFIPPVVEKSSYEEDHVSPFKAAPKAPIKRPKGISNVALGQEEEVRETEAAPVDDAPQIARFIPIPVVETPKSPFAPIGQNNNSANGLKAPIKRPKGISNVALGQEEEVRETEAAPVDDAPQIARFIPIPVVETPKSPFAPIGQNNNSANGLKAPIKRPPSASVNHAAAMKEEEEKAQKAASSPFKKAPSQEPANRPVKTSEKTFIPLAPVPFYEKPVANPFAAAPASKTSVEQEPYGSTAVKKPVWTTAAYTSDNKIDAFKHNVAPVEKESEEPEIPVSGSAAETFESTSDNSSEVTDTRPIWERSPIENIEEIIEEEDASNSGGEKKSRLDRIMDGLNRPLF